MKDAESGTNETGREVSLLRAGREETPSLLDGIETATAPVPTNPAEPEAEPEIEIEFLEDGVVRRKIPPFIREPKVGPEWDPRLAPADSRHDHWLLIAGLITTIAALPTLWIMWVIFKDYLDDLEFTTRVGWIFLIIVALCAAAGGGVVFVRHRHGSSDDYDDLPPDPR